LVQAACDLTTWTQALLLDGELAVANQDAAVSAVAHSGPGRTSAWHRVICEIEIPADWVPWRLRT
jgi:hypothetical protein